MTRRYGEQIVLSKVATSSTAYTTGSRTRTYTSTTIRNAVRVPTMTAHNVTYTPSMMQAVRQFAWQGGAGTDAETVSFMIADQDVRGWGEVDATQYITWRDESYEVQNANHFDGGIIVNCVAAKGSRPTV